MLLLISIFADVQIKVMLQREAAARLLEQLEQTNRHKFSIAFPSFCGQTKSSMSGRSVAW